MSFLERELVERYNIEPNSLLSKVMKVAVNQKSIAANNSDSITLASVGNGNYWLISDTEVNYWLLPKAKLRIDKYRYETVKLLFDCHEYDPEYHSFKLDRLAQVSILDNNSEWKLEKRGVLKFINPLKFQNTQDSEYKENTPISYKNNKSNPPPQTLTYKELLDTYNNNPKLLEKNATKVLETASSIDRKRLGISEQIVLEKATKSNYWVVYDNTNNTCWLFFKNNMRVSEYRYQNIQALFECYGYQPDYLSFELVKPAKLISLATEEQKWIIEKLGILKFI